MKLSKLLERFESCCIGNTDIEVNHLVYDSRKAGEGDVFLCIVGVRSDGHEFVDAVIRQGAVAIVSEKEIKVPRNVTLILVKDTREALARMSAAYFDYPTSKLKTIGITGTKGKTTTAYMIYSILQKVGMSVGLIGTIETRIGDEVIPSENTTPESYLVQEYFARMVDAGCTCVVMEVSSQGLKLRRVAGITFDYGIFTNLESDHIGPGEHENFEDYIVCKSLLFQNCRVGIVNFDDKYKANVLRGHTCSLETFGLGEGADLRATEINLHSESGELGVKYQLKGIMDLEVQVNIPGIFTVYNSLTAIAVCNHFKIPAATVLQALLEVKVKGRVELISISDRFTLMIDYAHNAMSLESLLSTLRDYHPNRIVCLFGCGGNRSRDRRYEMGEISSRMADFTVVTSDNPRFEEPQEIIDDIITGVKRGSGRYITVCDRKEAIRYCILHAEDGDIVVLAGKGHEDYQEIRGVKYHMDERDLIREVLEEMTVEEKLMLNACNI